MPSSSAAASDSDLSPAVSGGGADRDSPAVSGADDGDSDRDSPAVSGGVDGDSVDGEEAEGQEDDGDEEYPGEVAEEEEEEEGEEDPVEEVEDDGGGGESAEEAVEEEEEEEEEVSVGEEEEGMSVDDEDVGESVEEAIDEEEEKVGEDDAGEAIDEEEDKAGEDAEEAIDEEEEKVGEEAAEAAANEDDEEMEVDGEDAGAAGETVVKEEAEEAAVEEVDHGEGRKEGAGSDIIDAKDTSVKVKSEELAEDPTSSSCPPDRVNYSVPTFTHVKDENVGNIAASNVPNPSDTSAKVESEELAEDPTSSSCPPDRVNHSVPTFTHVKDENVGNIAAPNVPNPSDEAVSEAQLEKEILQELVKGVKEPRDSEIYSKVSESTRSGQENDIAARGGNVYDGLVENEAPHLHTNVPDGVVGNEVPDLRPKIDLPTNEGLRLSSLHTPEKRPRSSLSPDAIIGNANKKPAIICDFFARGWCIKGKSCRFLHQKEGFLDTNPRKNDLAGISQNGGDELPKFHSDHNMHGKHPQSGRTSYPPIGDFRQTSVESTFIPEYGPYSGGSSITSSLYQSSSSSLAYDRKRDGFTIPNQESHSGIHGFTRLSAEHLDTRTPLEFGIGNYGSRSASLPINSSPVEVRRNLSPFAGKTSRVQDAWEPSVPFRSSFGHKPGDIPSYSSPYDPLLDSIEPSNLAKSSYQPFQKTIINDVSDLHMNGNPILPGIHTPGCSAQEYVKPVPQYNDPVLGKSTVDHVANGAAATVTTRGHSKVDGGNNLTSKEGKRRIPGRAVDGANINDGEAGPGGNLKNIEDKGRNNKEPRTLKFFHCALADVVKELVKPSWREGHLSKDAHKMVVKKAVEKILSAIQPHQVPSTPELVNQYLSTSRPKILKLVEGYVHKYAKSGSS